MVISLSASEKSEMERLILVTALGLLESLKNNVLTIDECQNYLFSPYTQSILEAKKIDEAVVATIEKCLFLEDYEDLLPNQLTGYIEQLREDILELIENRNTVANIYEVKKWLDK
ncbi:DUF3969 family protein [Enterococcus sp. LJL51]|uniref:DUF3969 family protein n=1 Tax=Enterococcus sp. LJL51 TaxID=3416656 RepID=UPI003CF15539